MKPLVLTLFLALTAPFGVAHAQVHEYKLDNGMKVIVKEDHRAPVVVSQVWYKVGSSYEVGGITGISHALEHMMFKGTEKLGPGEFSRIIAANGGEENAFTSRDYTAYFQKLAKDRLEISFELEADRMRRLRLPADEFAKEIEVVKEERRLRTEDKPESLTYEQFIAGAYAASPYHNPVIGWMSDLDAMTVEDLRDWYQRWYAPDNAILVVVGDVDAEQVLSLARKHFEPLRGEEHRPAQTPAGAAAAGCQTNGGQGPGTGFVCDPGVQDSGDRRCRAGLGTLCLGNAGVHPGRGQQFPVEPQSHQGLSDRLGGGRGATACLRRLPGMLVMDANPASGHDIAEVEAALLKEVEKLKTDLVDEDELSRIRAQLVASKVFERDSVFYQAMQIGRLEAIGMDWRLQRRIRGAAECGDRRTGAQPWPGTTSTEDRMTVAVLDPLPLEGGEPAGTGGRHVH